MPAQLDLAAYAAMSPSIPKDKDRSELRVYAAVIAASTCWSLLQPALYLIGVEASPLRLVAMVAGGDLLFAVLFALAAVLVLPHLISLAFFPGALGARLPRQIASAGLALGAMIWGVLAYTAKPLDLGILHWTYLASSVGYVIVAGAFGYSLNAQQAEELTKCAAPN